jgi:hypothetical protein
MVLILGLLLLFIWAVLAFPISRRWRLFGRPLRRISDIHAPELVKVSGLTHASTAQRVHAPLSGEPVVFFIFEGIWSRRFFVRRLGGVVIKRRGVPFVVDDGSGAVAVVADPGALTGGSTSAFTVLDWNHPGTVAAVEQRLGEPLKGAQRLQARELTVKEGQPITLIAQARREGERVLLSGALGDQILVATESDSLITRQIALGWRVLWGTLAVALALVAVGAWTF